jgi:tRNA-specific 2-thiouridylase
MGGLCRISRMTETRQRVLVALSGGVDSSVAAWKLQQAGCEVTGLFLHLHPAGVDGAASTGGCGMPQHADDARRVAGALGIELIERDLSGAFEPILDEFAAVYAAGRTPNPCIGCNRRIKFAELIRQADEHGLDAIATGHYARVGEVAGRPALLRGASRDKDQSYVLFQLPPAWLARLRLPVGELANKDETRRIARQAELPVHDKPDSQDICFAPGDDYTRLLADRVPEALEPGEIVDSAGHVVGEHEGYGRYTIGQRRGLGVAAGEPLYVKAIDPEANRVTVGPREEVLARGLKATGASWLTEVPPQFAATVQIRYNHAGADARVLMLDEESFAVRFDEPVAAITPGQAAVVYGGEQVLGGGWIDEVLRDEA